MLLFFCFICIFKIPLSQGVMSQPTPKTSTIKNFAVSNNGAFNFVSVLNRHASIEKIIKKTTKKRSIFKKSASNPTEKGKMLCVGFSTVQPKTKERSRGKIRSNTIFTSNNWGNIK